MLVPPNLNKPFFQINMDAAIRAAEGQCITCGEDIVEDSFKDDLSKDEYSISGMCQLCQDGIFDEDNNLEEWCDNCDDHEGGLFEDDGDALASAGMGTDEDYGAW